MDMPRVIATPIEAGAKPTGAAAPAGVNAATNSASDTDDVSGTSAQWESECVAIPSIAPTASTSPTTSTPTSATSTNSRDDGRTPSIKAYEAAVATLASAGVTIAPDINRQGYHTAQHCTLAARTISLAAIQSLRWQTFVLTRKELAHPPYLSLCRLQYFKFLKLVAKLERGKRFYLPSPPKLVPTIGIDIWWSAHLIRPGSYARFCLANFGMVIDRDMAAQPHPHSRIGRESASARCWYDEYKETYVDPVVDDDELTRMPMDDQIPDEYHNTDNYDGNDGCILSNNITHTGHTEVTKVATPSDSTDTTKLVATETTPTPIDTTLTISAAINDPTTTKTTTTSGDCVVAVLVPTVHATPVQVSGPSPVYPSEPRCVRVKRLKLEEKTHIATPSSGGDDIKQMEDMVALSAVIEDREWIINLRVYVGDFGHRYGSRIYSSEFVSSCLQYYKKFLYLAATQPVAIQRFVPPYPIDLMWHVHMMHPGIYAADSRRLTGGPLFDHAPWPDVGDDAANAAAEHERQTFGVALWYVMYHEEPWPNGTGLHRRLGCCVLS